MKCDTVKVNMHVVAATDLVEKYARGYSHMPSRALAIRILPLSSIRHCITFYLSSEASKSQTQHCGRHFCICIMTHAYCSVSQSQCIHCV